MMMTTMVTVVRIKNLDITKTIKTSNETLTKRDFKQPFTPLLRNCTGELFPSTPVDTFPLNSTTAKQGNVHVYLVLKGSKMNVSVFRLHLIPSEACTAKPSTLNAAWTPLFNVLVSL